jgi:hypothetical protein
MAVVGADKWEEVVAMLLAGTSVLQAETRYFATSEMAPAWDWVRSSKNADHVPIRRMYLGTGLFKVSVRPRPRRPLGGPRWVFELLWGFINTYA